MRKGGGGGKQLLYLDCGAINLHFSHAIDVAFFFRSSRAILQNSVSRLERRGYVDFLHFRFNLVNHE